MFKQMLKIVAARTFIVNDNMGIINTRTLHLSPARNRQEATADCNNIAISAQNIIDFYGRDQIDEKGLKLANDEHGTAGSKLVKAQSLNIRILDETAFLTEHTL